jgi:3-phosphoshikimate 1-carboxyvinyltransferase
VKEIESKQIFDIAVRLPGSKSFTHRILMAAALSNGPCEVIAPLVSEDTDLTAATLQQWGVAITPTRRGCRVKGLGGRFLPCATPVDLVNSGTSMRLLTALAALGQGRYVLTGSPRLQQRPMRELIDALVQAGVEAEAVNANGCPPVAVLGGSLLGGDVSIDCSVSSQYLSALLLVAPLAPLGMDIQVSAGPVSTPYIDMTLAIMRQFGIEVVRDGYHRFGVAPGQAYHAKDVRVEPDASNASYFWAAAAVTGATVKVLDLNQDSCQGDTVFVDLLARMGCTVAKQEDGIAVTGGPLRGIDVDMAAMPDLVPTLAVVAAFAQGTTTIRNVAHLRFKESDRLAAMTTELRKMGAAVESDADAMTIVGEKLHGARINTYDDHRIAMSFAVAGLKVSGVVIEQEQVVNKSFPTFWEVFEGLYGD